MTLICYERLFLSAKWQYKQIIENALWGMVVFMGCYRDFTHKHNNVQRPYIIMLLLHSTHKYAQWGVALLTCNYCAYLSLYGYMPVYVFLYMCWTYVTCNQIFPPHLTNRCWAAASLWGQLQLSPWKLNVSLRLSSIPACILSGCVVLMHGFHRVGHLQRTKVKLTGLCVFIQCCWSLFWRFKGTK